MIRNKKKDLNSFITFTKIYETSPQCFSRGAFCYSSYNSEPYGAIKRYD